MATSYSIRTPEKAHDELDRKLSKANIKRARLGKKVLSKGAWVENAAKAETIKNIVDMD